jgi:hypothetical protein
MSTLENQTHAAGDAYAEARRQDYYTQQGRKILCRCCSQPKMKFSLLFCAMHELQWIAYDGRPSLKLDSEDFSRAVWWSYFCRL